MSKSKRLEEARQRYRDALEAARAQPSPEAWARLLSAGKALSDAQHPGAGRTPRRGGRADPLERNLDEVADEEDGRAAREAELD